MIDSFKTISEYCTRSEKSIHVRNHAFCLFVTTFQRALEEHKSNNGIDPKPKEIADKKAALLTPDAIEGYISRSESIIDAAADEIRKKYEKSFQSKQFWISVLSSVVAAFIYSLLLLLIYLIIKGDMSSLIDLIKSVGT